MESIPHPAFSLRPPHRPHPRLGWCGGRRENAARLPRRIPGRFLLGKTCGPVALWTGGFIRTGGPLRPAATFYPCPACFGRSTPNCMRPPARHRSLARSDPSLTRCTDAPGGIPVVRTSPQRDVAVVSPCLETGLSAHCHFSCYRSSLDCGGDLLP